MASKSYFDSRYVSQESPSVPMSVYRELAGELQAARAHANVLRSKNQQLQEHNLALRQEIEALVAATDRARALAARSESGPGQQVVSLPMSRLPLEAEFTVSPPNLPSPPQTAAPAREIAEVKGRSPGIAALAVAIVVLFSGLGFAVTRVLTYERAYPQQHR